MGPACQQVLVPKARCCAASVSAQLILPVCAPSSAALLERSDVLISMLHHMPGRQQPAQHMAAVNSFANTGISTSTSQDGHLLSATCLSDGASHVVCVHMQLICMAKKRGTKVINVVRRQDIVQELKDLGYANTESICLSS